MEMPVIKASAYSLIHVPDFICYGSKPSREIMTGPADLAERIKSRLRSFEQVVAYPPNQVFIGNLKPDDLKQIQRPWFEHLVEGAERFGPYGEIMPEDEFLSLLKLSDDFDLVWFTKEFIIFLKEQLKKHPLFKEKDLKKLEDGTELTLIMEKIKNDFSLPLFYQSKLIGCFNRHHDQDESLSAPILMENLMAKASGALVMNHLLKRSGTSPSEIDYILSCSEEAVGDRYNRGGGNMAKAIGELSECLNATGSDVKAFCAAPIFALVHAGSLVKSGVFEKVAVVGGGCLAKIGMKFKSHLEHDMPILEDTLAAIAFLVMKDDGVSPIIRLDAIGKHDIGASSAQQAILESLIVKPLEKIGKKITDIDKYATEMHNPEITVPARSGDVPRNNYRMIGALAAMRKEIEKTQIDQFVEKHGMPGFSPTQGHVPAAVPFLGHAMDAIRQGTLKNAMFLAKGSLFLGRMSQLSDGMSFLLEPNPNRVFLKGGEIDAKG